MTHFDRFRQFLGTPLGLSRNLREKFAIVTDLLLGGQSSDEGKRFRQAFQSLVYPLLLENGRISADGKSVYHRLLEEQFDLKVAETHLAELEGMTPMPTAEAAEIISSSAPEKALRTAEFLIALAVSLGGRTSDISAARNAAVHLGMKPEDFSAFLRRAAEEESRKQRLRKSSRGIIAALVVIAVFFLTAKYLHSVIFGVLLACILLPLEKFYERRLTAGRGIFFVIIKLSSLVIFPLRKLSEVLTRRAHTGPFVPDSRAPGKEKKVIRQAVILSAITAMIVSVGIAVGVSKLTGHYMSNLQHSIQLWEKDRVRAENGSGAPVSRYTYALEKLRENFESIPIVQSGLDFLAKIIKDPEVRNQMTRSLLRNSGGIINITGGFLGWMISLCCDFLLTIFFALLFLLKFAEIGNTGKVGSEYIVRNFFNGIWLPGADENLIRETSRIIDGILFRLRVWLKGYLTLILVDSTFYTTGFFFLGVPFFLPLGIIAGCGIALPYLGPVISCALTLLVTIASGGATGEMLLAIIVCYLVYNGLIEQFILYPAVIGESLGLSTLETIIVVLLGAVFAGIPGMIFALPTASAAKLIIPQIYHGFSLKRNFVRNEEGDVEK